MKKKRINITLTDSEKEKAKVLSESMFGRANLSALVSYWINKYSKRNGKDLPPV